jgi:hypothetical protein
VKDRGFAEAIIAVSVYTRVKAVFADGEENTGSVELTIFIVIVTTARGCRDQTGTHISCCKQK